MSSFLSYLFQVSFVFSGFYLLYILLFRRFTFHTVNRRFLVAIIPLSLVFPFSNQLFPEIHHFTLELPIIEDFTALTNPTYHIENAVVLPIQTVNWSFWILVLYSIGCSCYMIRFVRTTYQLCILKRKAEKVIQNGEAFYMTDVSEVFSYFNWIFVPKTTIFPFDELILIHEKAHVQKRHSVDVILAELFILFCWFHPLVYLYRKSLKSTHEFEADAYVMAQNVKKSTYLTLLLYSLTPKHTNPIYNYFSHPTLKKRIEMITKSPSKNNLKLTYLLVIPVIALVFMAFKTTTIDTMIHAEVTNEVVSNEIPSISPIRKQDMTRLSSLFKVKRTHPKLKNTIPHGGIDIVAKKGAPIVATADGVVMKAKTESNWGNLIVISHANGFETWYAHLQGFNTTVQTNVKKGDIIGYVGNTGRSTGPHLHYEVRQHGKRLDPMKYITE